MENKKFKELILTELKGRLLGELKKAQLAYDSSHEYATSSELKSEGKYDTRAIEAGYLAGAQKKRVDELEFELCLLDEVSFDHTNESVCVGSVAEISFNGVNQLYFVSSTSGGSLLNIEGSSVVVISAFSPIGVEVIGLEVGDTFEVNSKNTIRNYEVKKIF